MSKSRETLSFDDRWLMLIGIPAASFLVSALMFGDLFEHNIFYNLSRCTLVSIIYTTIFWLSFRQIFIVLRRRYPEVKDSAKRIVLQTISVLIAYFFIKAFMDIFLEDYMHLWLGLDEPHGVAKVFASLTLTFLIIAIYESIFFYSSLQKSIVEKEQLERENIQSQLEGLKNQVNPHFLFNSLNTLTYLIPEDQDLAVRFVQQLSKVYRYILEIRDRKLICLSEELAFLKSYVFLLKERFSSNFEVEINIPEEHLSKKVVPLSLQILMENAIKHNIISALKPLKVEVFVEKNLKLIVKNNLQKKNQVMNSTKVGLQNIKNRYSFFSDQKVEVFATADSFVVSIPLIEVDEEVK
jgi:two-component system, LytTR family, sensor kinase